MSPTPIQILALAGLASAAGCAAEVSEIVVTIDTSFGVPCAVNRIAVEVTSSSGESHSETVDVDADSLPGSITLIASEAAGQLTVRVTGFHDDVPVAVAEERSVSFVDGVSRELRFLLDSRCSPGPCPAVSKGEFEALPAPAPRIECGQERYTRRESLALLTNACTGAPLGSVMSSGDDELEVASPIDPRVPFPFFFYGRPVTDLWVGDNGYLAFSTDAPRALNADVGDPRSLGEPGGFPEPGVLPFWDKLRVGQRICFALTGSEPNRLMWITWDRSCFGPSSCGAPEQGSLTFSVGLEESTNSVHIGYHTMTASGANDQRADGLSAVIGITSGGEAACPADECSPEGTCPSGDACGYSEFSALTTSLDPLPQLEFRPVAP